MKRPAELGNFRTDFWQGNLIWGDYHVHETDIFILRTLGYTCGGISWANQKMSLSLSVKSEGYFGSFFSSTMLLVVFLAMFTIEEET